MLGDLDTIAAIATPRGHGALSIVRISGSKTSEIVKACFESKTFDSSESHKVFHGFWKNPKSGERLDEVVLLHFGEGRGFTGEASCEVICHGGMVVTELVLEASLSCGARLARPGEFSYRAVVNGKMDLAQAESILEIISARTPKRAAQAIKNITGSFSRNMKAMENELIYVLAHLEASIDFTAEDIQPVNYKEIIPKVAKLQTEIAGALESYRQNQKIQNGLRVVIAGRPNAGKSSLLNTLSGKDRSIVTDIAGTTRDVIESEALLDGILVKYVDTAGLHQSNDAIEKIGMEKTREELEVADVILYVVDSHEGITFEDAQQLKALPAKNTLLCFNKIDLEEACLSTDLLDLSPYKKIALSCATQSGIAELKSLLSQFVKTAGDSETSLHIASQRQEQEFLKCEENLKKALELLSKNESPDLISFEFKNALLNMKQILGEEMNDEIMDKVFKEFCIGK